MDKLTKFGVRYLNVTVTARDNRFIDYPWVTA